jgi:hypothetical protein
MSRGLKPLDPNKQATAFEPLSEKALVKRASALDLEVLLLGEESLELIKFGGNMESVTILGGRDMTAT